MLWLPSRAIVSHDIVLLLQNDIHNNHSNIAADNPRPRRVGLAIASYPDLHPVWYTLPTEASLLQLMAALRPALEPRPYVCPSPCTHSRSQHRGGRSHSEAAV